MSQFLEIYNLPRLNYEAEDMNTPIMSKETESVIKTPQKEAQDQMVSPVSSTKHLKKN